MHCILFKFNDKKYEKSYIKTKQFAYYIQEKMINKPSKKQHFW